MQKTARAPLADRTARALPWNPSGRRDPRLRVVSRHGRAKRPTLLWIDDFELGLTMYRAMFEALGYRVLTTASGEAGLQVAARNRIDIVVTDYEMPGMDGESLALAMKALHPQVPVVLFSGSTLVSDRVRQMVDAVCDKAGSREQLLATVHFLLHKKPHAVLQPPPLAQASDVQPRAVA